ncbi:MAG: HDOD domain-containing protein [Gammaproteobacteria bacterium]|nr:HDOD domain-containing protein [Gammaproteobacteria bacterium]
MPRSAESLVKGAISVASLPEIFIRLNEEVNNPYSNLSDIADIISEDTGLAARMLRIANSAMFNFPSPVLTISHAITILGTRQLRDIVLATYAIKTFKDISGDLVNMRSFWQHSIACGIAARVLATYQREPNIERFYVLGLLHDIGLLILYQEIPSVASTILKKCRQEELLLYAAEEEVLGYNHALVGRLLLKAWKLPESAQEAVGCHHCPRLATSYPDEAALIHVADILATAMQMGDGGEHRVPPIEAEAWARIGLQTSMINDITQQIDLQYNDVVELFLA